MTVATFNDALFAVAHAPLPAADRGNFQRAAGIERGVGWGVYASLKAPPPADIPVDGTPLMIKGQGERVAS